MEGFPTMMVHFMENPIQKWMMTGTPIGILHIVIADMLLCLGDATCFF